MQPLFPKNFSWRYNALLPIYARTPTVIAYKLAKYQSYWVSKTKCEEKERIRNEMRRASFELIGHHLADYYCMIEREALDTCVFPKIKQIITLNGFEKVQRARAAGKKIILTSGHYGRFWMAGFAMRAKGMTVGTIMRTEPADNMNHLSPAESHYHIKKLKHLQKIFGGPFLTEGKNLQPLCHVLDRHLMTIIFDLPCVENKTKKVSVAFLGGRIEVPTDVYRIASQSEALVAPFFMREEGKGRLSTDFEDLLNPQDYSEVEFMQKLVKKLEKRIRQRPGQWQLWESLPILRHSVKS